MLSRRILPLMRRGGRAGKPSLTELQRLETYLARNLFSWARPDARVEAGGFVSGLIDRVALVSEGATGPNARSVDPAHTFVQASAPNQCSSPTSPAAWNGKPVLTFAAGAGNRYTSNISGASWNFGHNGTGMEAVVVCSMTSLSTLSALLATTDSGILHGFQMYVTATSGVTNAGVYRVSSTVVNTTPAGGAIAVSTPTYVSLAHATASNPDWAKRVKGAAPVTGAYVGPAGAGDAQAPLTIGALNTAGLFPANMQLADVLIMNRDDATLRTAYQRYIFLRYGIAA